MHHLVAQKNGDRHRDLRFKGDSCAPYSPQNTQSTTAQHASFVQAHDTDSNSDRHCESLHSKSLRSCGGDQGCVWSITTAVLVERWWYTGALAEIPTYSRLCFKTFLAKSQIATSVAQQRC